MCPLDNQETSQDEEIFSEMMANMHEVDSTTGATKMTAAEYRPGAAAVECDECYSELRGNDRVYVDGEPGTMSWVLCATCHGNYIVDIGDDVVELGNDGRVMPTEEVKQEPVKKPFKPSDFAYLSIVQAANCDGCTINLLPGCTSSGDNKAFCSEEAIYCKPCYVEKAKKYSPFKETGARQWCTTCSMMTDNEAHAAEHTKRSTNSTEADGKWCVGCQMWNDDGRHAAEHTKRAAPVWTEEVLKVHDGRDSNANCSGTGCGAIIKADEKAWFDGPLTSSELRCQSCYKKGNLTAPAKQTSSTQSFVSTMGFTTHHKHEPMELLGDKTGKWSVSACSRDGLIAHANKFDIVMNLSGRSIHERHIIPIPELDKWKHGSDTFQEMLLDWPDNGVAYFPLQFWLDVHGHITSKNLKMSINCVGGHGRTGTALACMLIVALGWGGEESIKWIRANYCDRAIESKEQERYIEKIALDMKAHNKALKKKGKK